MDTKNKSNIKLLSIVASVMLLIIVVGASFAYFGTYKEDIDKYKINITIDEFAKATFVSKPANLNLTVDKKNMVEYESGKKASEGNANLNVVLTSGNPNVKVTCTYDIYYEYDTNSSIYGVSPTVVTDFSKNELTLKATGEGETNYYSSETNFNYDSSWTTNPYKKLIVKGATVTDATTTGTTATWNFDMSFYNLEEDQNHLAGKSFTGSFYVDKDSIQCNYENNDGESGSEGTAITTLLSTSTPDVYDENGLRYEGADPNNYVCLDSNKEGTCSDSSLLFRIIGLFDEEYSLDGTNSSGTMKLLKILDTNNYGGSTGKYWSGSSSNESNDWSKSTLNTELNGTYLSTLLATSGVNSKLSRAIVTSKWHLGGANAISGSNYYLQTITTENWYKAERSPYATSGTLQNLYSGNPEYVYAKVGLMYPSDYGYASVGGSTTNKENCRITALSSWNSSSYSDCKNNDWVYKYQSISWGSNKNEWFISPYASNSVAASSLNSAGYVLAYNNVSDNQFAVQPTFYLNSSILKIVGGEGTEDNAYRIG